MDTKLLINHVLMRFKNIAVGMIFFLLAISLSSDVCSQPFYQIKERAGLYKDISEGRMFLITVIDSEDDSIGKRCEKDLNEMTNFFEELADWLDVEMEEPKIIKGDQFSKAAVNDAIDNWLRSQEPAKNDIVVFYYSGHGFRYPNDPSDYPRMWLKTASDKNTQTTNLRIEEDVYDRIIKMGAGVNIILSDCCNTTDAGDIADFDNVTVPTYQRVQHKREHHGHDHSNDDDLFNADKLFIPNQPLSILVTAAEEGEFAGGKAETGGFFTRYFIEALDKCIYYNSVKPTWESIFKYADENAGYWARSAECPQAKHNEQGRCVQTAKFQVDSSD